MHEVARQPSERQSLYIGLYNEPEKNEGFLYSKSKQPPDDTLELKTKSQTSYTMRSGNHPCISKRQGIHHRNVYSSLCSTGWLAMGKTLLLLSYRQ